METFLCFFFDRVGSVEAKGRGSEWTRDTLRATFSAGSHFLLNVGAKAKLDRYESRRKIKMVKGSLGSWSFFCWLLLLMLYPHLYSVSSLCIEPNNEKWWGEGKKIFPTLICWSVSGNCIKTFLLVFWNLLYSLFVRTLVFGSPFFYHPQNHCPGHAVNFPTVILSDDNYFKSNSDYELIILSGLPEISSKLSSTGFLSHPTHFRSCDLLLANTTRMWKQMIFFVAVAFNIFFAAGFHHRIFCCVPSFKYFSSDILCPRNIAWRANSFVLVAFLCC